jgi:hypothetical protein
VLQPEGRIPVLRFGIWTRDQFNRAYISPGKPIPQASYALLDVPDDATEQDIRMFEAITLGLHTSNGTSRATVSHRFDDVDCVSCRVLKQLYDKDSELFIQDRAMSHGLTSCEWAQKLFRFFPLAQVEASDRILFIYRVSLPSGETFIVEPDGHPLQYIRPPFVVSIAHREPLRFPLNHVVAAYAKRKFRRLALHEHGTDPKVTEESRITEISCVHPRARSLSKTNTHFCIRTRCIFDRTPGIDVLRTMNILNKTYFRPPQLIKAAIATFESLKPGGIWIVGRTLEEDLANHATILRRHEQGWEVLERVGRGSEMEEFAQLAPAFITT